MAAQDFELILRVQADLQQAVSQLRTLNDQMRVTKTAAVEASGGLAAIGTSAKAGEAGIRSMDTQLTGIGTHMGKINAAAHDLRNAFIFAFAAHEVVNFTSSLVDANIKAQRIQYTLQQVFGEQGAKEQFEFLKQESDKLGLSLADTAQGYAELAASAQGTGTSTESLRKVFIGMNEAATVLHTSAADVAGVFTQLSQGISLGTLHMQDIRAIAQHLPGTMSVLREATARLGTTLEDALAHGGLDAKKILESLGDVLHERFGVEAVEASHSLNAELNRLHSTFFELQTDGTGFADNFAAAIAGLNSTLSDSGLQVSLKDLIVDFGLIASAAVSAAGKIGQALAGIQGIAQYAAFLKTGYVDQDQTQIQQENEFNALIAKRQQLQQSLADLTGVERKLGLGAHLESELSEVTAQIKAAQDAQKAAQVAAHPGGAEAGLIARNNQDKALFAGLPPGGAVSGVPATSAPDAAALHAAAELAKQATRAQDALTKSLIDLQSQLDPTAAIYAKYNEAVKKATDEATLAKKAHGADAQAIDAQRDAVVALAGKVRDAALDQLAEKDREAWEALRRSFETPAEVRVEDALKQIAKLNDLLKEGIINSDQYHAALNQIGQKSVTGALPTYQGLDAAVGGPYSELQKNYAAQTKLDAAFHAQKLALDAKFNDQDEAQHQAHVAALAKLDQDYATQSNHIEQSRQTLQLTAAANLFGQLATLSSSHNKKMAAIGKAAAIAQTIIQTYQSATEAYAAMASIPYIGPELGIAAAAAAVVAGLANVAQIRSQSTGGYSEGGYTGPGGKYQVAGVVHAGEGVLSQSDISALGGPVAFNWLRRNLRGFANGGFVSTASPLANAPSPASLGFTAPVALPMGMVAANAAANDSRGDGKQGGTTHVHVWSVEEAAEKIAALPSFEKAVVHVVGNNPRKIRGKWGS